MIFEVRGVSVEADPSVLNDMRIIGLLADWSEGDATAIFKIARRILGAAQTDGAMKELEEDGICSIDSFADFVSALITDMADSQRDGSGKNS